MKTLLPLLVSGLMLIGCSEQPEVMHQRVQQKNASYSFAIPEGSKEPSKAERKKRYTIDVEIVKAVMSNLSNEQAHAKVQHLLEEGKSVSEIWEIEQYAAMMMLDQRLNKAVTLSKNELAAVGFYTELLLKWNNPNAGIIQPALAHLKTTWTPAQIQKAEQHAVAVASAWMQKEGHGTVPACKGCENEAEQAAHDAAFRDNATALAAMQRHTP